MYGGPEATNRHCLRRGAGDADTGGVDREILKATWNRLRRADLTLNGAAVAFHTFFAIIPLGFALLGFAAWIGRDQGAVARVLGALSPIAPEAFVEFIAGVLAESERRIAGEWWVVAVSVGVSLFLGARAVVALQRALAAVQGTLELRQGARLRLVAIGLTAAGGVVLLITGTVLVGGRTFFAFLEGWSGIPGLLGLWAWLSVPVATAGLFGFLFACYRYGPPRPMPRATLAATIGTVGVLALSLGFGLYLSRVGSLGVYAGTLGTVAVILTWLYLGAVAILAGAALVSGESQS